MKLSARYSLNAPQEIVFSALVDPEVLQKCIDGCEKMEKTGEDSYDAHLKIGVAGIKGSYIGKIRMEEKKAPESFKLLVEGKGAPGWVKGMARIQILSKDDASELECEAEGQVGGVIAAVGSRLVSAVGKKMLDEFFRKLGQQVCGEPAVSVQKSDAATGGELVASAQKSDADTGSEPAVSAQKSDAATGGEPAVSAQKSDAATDGKPAVSAQKSDAATDGEPTAG